METAGFVLGFIVLAPCLMFAISEMYGPVYAWYKSVRGYV